MNHQDTKNTKAEKTLAVVPVKPIKVPKIKTGDDAEIAAEFTKLFNEAQNGLRRVIAFGIFAQEIKETKLKHGQFGPWVEANCPGVSYRSVRAYMQLTESTLEAVGYKSINGFLKKCAAIQNGSTLPISHSGQLLLMPGESLPSEAIDIRTKIFALIDGKSARQLFAEFKQAEEDEDGNARPKRGRLKGQGGASAAQRAAAKAALEAGKIDAMEMKGEEFRFWVYEICDDAHGGQGSDDFKRKMLECGEFLVDYFRARIKKGE